MHFTMLSLRNFGPFEKLDLEFQRGSVGIFGRNGSGKTTLLNGMYGLLTNDFRRFDGVKADCIRNTAREKAESYIYGRVEHDGHTLSIKRGLYPSKTSVVVDGGKEITDANKAQEEIDAALGLDGSMLDLYVFKTQDRIYDFISTTPAERAKAFAVLCRTEHCEHVWDFLGKFLSKDAEVNAVIVDNSDELVTQVSQLEAKVSELEASIKAEEEKLLNAKSEQSAREILRKQDRLEDLLDDQNREQQKQETYKFQLKELEPRREKLEKKLCQLKEECDNYRATAEDARAALKAWDAYQKYRNRRKKLKQEADNLAEEEKNSPPPEPRHGDAPLDELRQHLHTWRRQLKDAQATVKTFEATGLTACPTCGTPVDSLQDHLQQAREHVKDLPAEIKAVERQIEEIEEHQKAVRRYEKWRAAFDAKVEANRAERESLQDVKAPDGDREELQQKVAAYEARVKERDEMIDRLNETVDNIRQIDAKYKAGKVRLAEIESAIADNTEPAEKVERARRRLDEHTAARQNIASLRGEIRGLHNQIEDKQEELKKLRFKLKKSKRVRRLAKIAERCRDVLHRDCLPRRVAQANLAQMEGDINEGLEQFGDPFWVESDPSLTFVAHKPGEPPQPAGRLSTGQRVVLALSFWPAVASLWSHDLGMLALDEPTANLDEENRKFLSQALGTLTAKVRGRRQLIMVTHDPNLRTAFDQVIDL